MNRPRALLRTTHSPLSPRRTTAIRVAAVGLCLPLAVTAAVGASSSASARPIGPSDSSVTSLKAPVTGTVARVASYATAGARAADSAGAPAVGAAGYAIPAGAVFVATTGSDSAAGTVARPVRTIARALVLAPAGGTVVLRGGTYHETVAISQEGHHPELPEGSRLDGRHRSR